MNQQKENPLSVQSKQWLLAALLKLMEEKEFGAITIQELAREADLDRKTFYRNFKSKEDVLSLRLHELCQLYAEKLHALTEFTTYEISKAYFDICLENAGFFLLLKKNHLLPLALLKFDEYLPMLNDLFLENPQYRNKSHYELAYQAGGFWYLTIHWINGGIKESPEEMAALMTSIMPPPTNSLCAM